MRFAKQFGKDQAGRLGRADSCAQHAFDVRKQRGIVECFVTCLDKLTAQSFADAAVQLRHHRVDIDACGVSGQSLRLLLIER